MIRIWDGFLSGLCALITVAIIGVPLWGAYLSVTGGLIPPWTWVPIGLLGVVGLIMTLAFIRKAGRGVHPLRDRRR